MPSYKEWISKIDIEIDYYSAFIKAWIAFNSWYRSEYRERTDREIIEKLKTENNLFNAICEFVNAQKSWDALSSPPCKTRMQRLM